MKTTSTFRTVAIVIGLFLSSMPLRSQTQFDSLSTLQSKAPKVFIDCGFCDENYIRTEISFVNYVRDRLQADVHILITTQQTGSGGQEYTLTFIGQHNATGMNDTLTLTT